MTTPRSRSPKKKVSEGSAPHAQDHSLDSWIHGADDIKSALDQLRSAFSKRRLHPHPLTPPDDHKPDHDDEEPDDKKDEPKKPEDKNEPKKPDDHEPDKKPDPKKDQPKKPEEKPKKPAKNTSFSRPGTKFSIGPDGFKPHSK